VVENILYFSNLVVLNVLIFSACRKNLCSTESKASLYSMKAMKIYKSNSFALLISWLMACNWSGLLKPDRKSRCSGG
jgi:hypothetical protein